MKNRLSDTIVTAKARAEHIALWNDLAYGGFAAFLARRRGACLYCIDRHNRKVPGDDVVAVVANLLGHLIVVRDPDKVRSDEMLELVKDNITFGRRQAHAELATDSAAKPPRRTHH